MTFDHNMITFDSGERRFNFRAAAVIEHQGRILLHRIGNFTFWSMPGGRVEFGESAAETIVREMKEEIGELGKAEGLLWVVENFFVHEEKRYHELAFFFLLSFPTDSPLFRRGDEFTGTDLGVPILFKWLTPMQIREMEVYPSFLRERLGSLPTSTEYLTHVDN